MILNCKLIENDLNNKIHKPLYCIMEFYIFLNIIFCALLGLMTRHLHYFLIFLYFVITNCYDKFRGVCNISNNI